jgi:hypothetical protein
MNNKFAAIYHAFIVCHSWSIKTLIIVYYIDLSTRVETAVLLDPAMICPLISMISDSHHIQLFFIVKMWTFIALWAGIDVHARKYYTSSAQVTINSYWNLAVVLALTYQNFETSRWEFIILGDVAIEINVICTTTTKVYGCRSKFCLSIVDCCCTAEYAFYCQKMSM